VQADPRVLEAYLGVGDDAGAVEERLEAA
jgi:hypothetical protein